MLFTALLSLHILMVFCYLADLLMRKDKNFILSICIRLITLTLFGFVILNRFESQSHLIVLLLSWVGFEFLENAYKKRMTPAK